MLEAAVYIPSESTVDMQTVAKTLHAEMLATNDLIARAKERGGITPVRLAAWRAYRDAWAAWYAKTSSSTWDKDNIETRQVLTVYGQQLTDWKKSYASYGTSTGGGSTTPGESGGLSSFWLIAALVGGGFLLGRKRA